MQAFVLFLAGLLGRPAVASKAVQAGSQRQEQASDRAVGRLVRSEAAVGAGANVELLLQRAPEGSSAEGSFLSVEQVSRRISRAPLTVFYHVYQSDGAEGESVSASIVKEQMSVIKSSAAFGDGLKLNYVFIGPSGSSIPALLDCPTCHQLEYKNAGDEVITLQHVFDHCTQNPSERVLYMHTKGSFHRWPQNEALRRFLTKGVWSDECQHMPRACSACASRFSPLPHHHYPGNMWVARCEYISRLIAPSKFQAAMERVSLLAGAAPPLTANDRPWELGLGRFALEHWLPSHPSHAPCEVYSGTDFLWAYAFIPTTSWTPKLHVLPRPDMPLSRYCKGHPVGTDVAVDQNLTKVKAWRLFEWQGLYPEASPQSGVLWDYYKASAGGMCSAQPAGV
jgi:hypothetical protein